MQATP